MFFLQKLTGLSLCVAEDSAQIPSPERDAPWPQQPKVASHTPHASVLTLSPLFTSRKAWGQAWPVPQSSFGAWSPSLGFPGSSASKESACCAGNPCSVSRSGRSPGGGVGTHSSILAWRIPRTEEPGRLQSMGLQRIRHNWTTFTQSTGAQVLNWKSKLGLEGAGNMTGREWNSCLFLSISTALSSRDLAYGGWGVIHVCSVALWSLQHLCTVINKGIWSLTEEAILALVGQGNDLSLILASWIFQQRTHGSLFEMRPASCPFVKFL